MNTAFRTYVVAATVTGLVFGAGMAQTGPARGHVWYATGFEEPQAMQGWSGEASVDVTADGDHALKCERKTGDTRYFVGVVRSLPVEELRGYAIRCTATVRASDISDKPNPWNGIKFMLSVESPGRTDWPQAPIDTGSFDARRAGFLFRIPRDATAARLHLGLEQVTGAVWFDDVKLAVFKPPVAARPTAPSGPAFSGHEVPRLRGVMISPNIDEAGLRTLGRDWNANLIRWQLIRHDSPGKPSSLDDYDQWLEGELRRLDAALPHCRRYGLYVVVDLHSPPGGKATISGYIGSDDRLFTDRRVQEKFVEVWRKISSRYKDAVPIWGYDLANEPVEDWVEEGCDDWHDLAERTAREIRRIDPHRAIIVEASPWGSPQSLAEFEPIDVPGVVYSAHMYVPGEFTHQGVFSHTSAQYAYPGMIAGKMWDKPALEAALRPVIDFQRTYNVSIYMGEFSAIRWAPSDSACRYLRDTIDIFERHGWDWSYHAFREWHGWSVEHGSDRSETRPAEQPTDRQKLLCEWFARNTKPSWQSMPVVTEQPGVTR